MEFGIPYNPDENPRSLRYMKAHQQSVGMTPVYLRLLFLLFLMLLALWASYRTEQNVEIEVKGNGLVQQSNRRFNQEMGEDKAFQVMQDAADFVQRLFFGDPAAPRRKISKVILSIDDHISVSSATVLNVIHLSRSYIENFQGDVAFEIKGMIYHEMTHVWQWDGKGQAPKRLVEGIAAYVRLSAGFVRVSNGRRAGFGSRWDEDSEVTADFLKFCEARRPGFVSAMNAKLADGWSEKYFEDLMGVDVDRLFLQYKGNEEASLCKSTGDGGCKKAGQLQKSISELGTTIVYRFVKSNA